MSGWKSFGNLVPFLLFAILLISSQVVAVTITLGVPIVGTGNPNKPVCDRPGRYNNCGPPPVENCGRYIRGCPPAAAVSPQN